jgi:hypothetical protein
VKEEGMSFWDKTVGKQSHRWKQYPEQQLLLLMLACVDHAFSLHYPSLLKRIEQKKLSLAKAALDRLWSVIREGDGSAGLKDLLGQIYSIMPDEDSPEDLIGEWDYLLSGLASILRAVINNAVRKEVTTALDAAYQSIAHGELERVMLDRPGGLAGEEITEAERASPVCQREAAFQLECLRKVEAGEPLERSSAGG